MRIRALGTIATLLLTFSSFAVAAPSSSSSSSAKKEFEKVQGAKAAPKKVDAAKKPKAARKGERVARAIPTKKAEPKATIVHSETTVTIQGHHPEPQEAVAVKDTNKDQKDKDPKDQKFELPALPASLTTKLETMKAGVQVRAPALGQGKLPALKAETPIERVETPKPKFKPTCMRPAVTFMRGAEQETFTLTRCDGSTAPMAVEKLSMLARAGAAKPAEPLAELLKKAKGTLIAPGIKRLDPRLVEQLQVVIDHFAKVKQNPPKVHLVSGFRPTASGSYHASGHALDLKIEGVSNEALVGFCKTLPDVGCGYYPNSSFVHMDVRQPGTGHVSWIDASGPGESPRYVASWPPPRSTEPTDKAIDNSIPSRKPRLFEAALDALVGELDRPVRSAGSEVARLLDESARDRAAEAPAAALNVALDDDSKIEN